MKKRYKIILTHRIGDFVRMQLQPDEVIKEKSLGFANIINIATGGGDMEKLQKQLQQEAILNFQPDIVTIPYEEWKKHGYKIDDIVILNLEPEG